MGQLWVVVLETRRDGQTVEIYLGHADMFAEFLRKKIRMGLKVVSICCQG